MQIVKVRLRKPRRVLTILCNDIHLDRDDPCIVRTERGLEWAACVLPPEPCPSEMERRFTDQVVRPASEDDFKTLDVMEEEERKGRSVCLDRIKQHRMDMKLVDVECTFDKRKVVFYFTAEDRVDFRELVRDLAHDLRTRIELRHIQVRDEAKMVGGIGGCGRQLCCASWLDEFRPISMRMAKRQNLSLNPSKISGQCGRLLCCLGYENDQYESMKRRARQERPDPLPEPEPAPREHREHREHRERPRPAPPREDPAPAPEEKPAAVVTEETPQEEGPKKSSRRRRRRKPKGGRDGGGQG